MDKIIHHGIVLIDVIIHLWIANISQGGKNRNDRSPVSMAPGDDQSPQENVIYVH